MANRVIPKAHINAPQLLALMQEKGISIKELGRRQRIGYSDRQIRYAIKEKLMSWEMIFKICGELNLVFASALGKGNEPYVFFYDSEGDLLKTDMELECMRKLTFWTPVLDPCGFEYPTPVTR